MATATVDDTLAKRRRCDAGHEAMESSNGTVNLRSASSKRNRTTLSPMQECVMLADAEWSDALPTELPHIDLLVEHFSPSGPQRVTVRTVTCEDTCVRRSVHLCGFWSGTLLRAGCKLRVFAARRELDSTAITVGDGRNYAIAWPDTLVMCTTVAGGVYCRRRAVLNERFKGACDPGSNVMVGGTLLHCLCQSAIKISASDVTDAWLQRQTAKLMEQDTGIMMQLVALGWPPADVLEYMRPFFVHIRDWCTKYLAGRRPLFAGGPPVAAIRDIEENVWCSKFGVRGKVDISVVSAGADGRIIPIEIKTGKSSAGADHRGQALLYTLMLSSFKRGANGEPGATDGALLYLKDGSTHKVDASAPLLRGLLQLRNELAYYVSATAEPGQCTDATLQLPPVIDDERSCSMCPHRTVCSAFATTGASGGSATSRVYAHSVSHLSDGHRQYFLSLYTEHARRWCKTVSTRPANRDAWLRPAKERQSAGDCVCDLAIRSIGRPADLPRGAVTPVHTVTFAPVSGTSLPTSVFNKGDMVLVSSETRQHYVLFLGPVVAVDDDTITVSVDRRPRNAIRTDVFRLDRYLSVSTFQWHMSTLGRFIADDAHAAKLRSLFADGQSPVGKKSVSGSAIRTIKPYVRSLPKSQLQFVVKVLMATHGIAALWPASDQMGGGEFTDAECRLAASLLLSLRALDKSVLLCAQSNTCVDAVLRMVLADKSCGLETCTLRLGSRNAVHSDCAHLRPEALCTAGVSAQEQYGAVALAANAARVVACQANTAANHVLLHRRRFDYVLLLQADRVAACGEPVLIGPLLAASKFALVGRHGSDAHNAFHRFAHRSTAIRLDTVEC